MGGQTARPRVIRGTRTAPLPLLPSGPGGVCGRPLHGARDLTRNHRSMAGFRVMPVFIRRAKAMRNGETPRRTRVYDWADAHRSEEHTSELQSHSFISYAVFCLKKK